MAMKGSKNAKKSGKTQIVPGDILLGRYRVERKLGQGGMGVVVAARHLDLGELFAIKYLAKDARSDPNAVQRFLREARSSARLKSDNAVKVHDVGRLDSGVPYMIMEYLVGEDLKTYLHKHGKLPHEQAISFMLQASDAIAEAHALGIIHRDIKPSNLFLTKKRDGTPCIKVLDFGIAKDISSKDVELTKSGAALGSPMYMSPEQMAGSSKTVDRRTDIWSLGVVLYELIAGTVPFHAETITELVTQVIQAVPKPPSHHRSDVPSWIDDVVIRCLEKHPENRFLTIDDFIHALRAAGSPRIASAELPSSVPKDEPAQATDLLHDASLEQQKSVTSTKDTSTIDSSTKGGIAARVARNKEIAINTLTNPTWDTTTGAPQSLSRNRGKLGAMAGGALAIVILSLGGRSFFRARFDKHNAAASSEAPALAMASTESSVPTFVPSATLETVPQAFAPEPHPSAPVANTVSATSRTEVAVPSETRTRTAAPVSSTVNPIEKKETNVIPQAPVSAPATPPTAPVPSNAGTATRQHQGIY